MKIMYLLTMSSKLTGYERVFSYISSFLSEEMHLKRIASLSGAVAGAMDGARLGIAAIGKGLAAARGINSKHGIKQVDRLISNPGIDVWNVFAYWVPHLVGDRKEIVVAFDWTDFDRDGHATLAIHIVTSHGRASALIWKTYEKNKLKNKRNDYEDELLVRLSEVIPKGVSVTVLADRGFGDVELYSFLRELGFHFVVRFRGNVTVTINGVSKLAKEWLHPSGRAQMFKGVEITQDGFHIPAFVCVKGEKMKEAWFLACSDVSKTAGEIVKLYGKRFKIEESFRDIKNLRFGMGLSDVRIKSTQRRDRMLLICAIATTLQRSSLELNPLGLFLCPLFFPRRSHVGKATRDRLEKNNGQSHCAKGAQFK